MEPNVIVSLTLLIFAVTLLKLAPLEVDGVYIPPGPKYTCPEKGLIWPCQCLTSTDDGVTLKCEQVSLATLSAALQHPKVVQLPVESLHLVELNTEKVYGKVLQNLSVTSLRIERSPIVTILPDVFFHVRETLKNLEIVDTKLQRFPLDSLESLENLETLLLDKHEIQTLENVSIPATLGSLKSLRISNGNISSFSKTTFQTLGKLQRLDLHGNNLTTIPKDAFQNLKNLEYLDVAWNKFDKLEPGYFVHLNKLTWFNGSHNLIPDFKRGAFARNGFLRVIYLTHNKISKIDAAAFRGMRLLTRLYLSDNQISDVGRGAFNSLSRIKTIDLSRNQVKLVDFQMFQKLPFAEEIFLQENNLTRIKMGAFQELAYCVVNVSRNQISMIEKESFQNCVNMTVLDMSHNLIDNFTKNAFDENSYPNEWQLSHNKLKLTGDIPLKFMAGIKILNVSHNELREVNKNTFPKLYELHTVDLSWNNISKIHSSIFTNLFSLRHLNMSNNNLTDLSGSAFGAIPTVLELNLDNNRLKSVSNAAFSRMVSLRELTVSNNKLKKVFQISGSLTDLRLSNNEISSLSKAWPTMNALQRLDLSGNNLGGNLPGGSFDHLGALSRLNLAGNNLTEIPAEALQALTTVQYLDVSRNRLKSLNRSAFGRLPIVFELRLEGNEISTVEPKAFDGMLQLLHLDLSNNQLKSLPIGAFSGLTSMQFLNLSGNLLERTDNSTNSLFEECLSLQTLDLSSNRFNSIRSKTFPELRWTNFRLTSVDLSNNHLMVITKELLKGTRTLRKLNLSRNKITELRPSILGNLTNLREVDLSFNEISFVDAAILGPPPNLEVLNLEGNYLRKFPTEIFQSVPNLTLVNLEQNRFKLFNLEFLPKIKNGTRILLGGNPISCDCRLIFLQRHFQSLRPQLLNFSQEYFQDFHNFRCKDAKLTLDLMEENNLVCDYLEDPFAPKVPLQTDLEIRSISGDGQGHLLVRWRVTSKIDILGFQLELLDDTSGTIANSQTVSYTERMAKVPISGRQRGDRICLVPKLSREEISSKGNLKVNKVCQKLDNHLVGGSAIADSVFGGGAAVTTLQIMNLMLAAILVKLFS